MPCAGNNTLSRSPAPSTRLRNVPALRSFPVKKALQALSHDVRLCLNKGLRYRPQVVISLAIALAVAFLVLFISFHSVPLLPQNRPCACVSVKSSHSLALLLSQASFVARVQFVHTGVLNVTLSVHTLFRGPFSAARVPLVLTRKNTAICGWKRRSSNWLVIAGKNVPLDAEHSGSVVSAIPGVATHCSSRVWLFPWKKLSDDLKDTLSGIGRDFRISAFSSALRKIENSRTQDSWVFNGVSVVAACKGRVDTLKVALASWRAVNGIDEIVLVDWGSEPTLASTLSSAVLKDTRIVIVRVDAQPDWVLTHAYNLAFQTASRSRVLKVDCDTTLSGDFVAVHPLSRGTFYAGNWNALNTGPSNALHANGVLFAFRDDIFAVGGYDERIVTYGWDDTDLVTRLSHRLTARTIRYDRLHHIPHAPRLRSVFQQDNKIRTVLPAEHPFCAAVEIQRNRLLLTRYGLPIWSKDSSHVWWAVRLAPKEAAHIYNTFPISEVSPAVSLVSSGNAVDASKRAIRVILRRYGTRGIPRALSLDFIKKLSEKVAAPERYADVLFSLRGGCAARLLALAVASVGYGAGTQWPGTYISPPFPYEDWRVRFLWRASSFECSCDFYTAFEPLDAEILSTWDDVKNPVSNAPFPEILKNAIYNARSVLANFTVLSKPRNLSTSLQVWWPPASISNSTDSLQWHSLVTDLLCDSTLRNASAREVDSYRDFLRALAPPNAVASAIVNSLNSHRFSILDEPSLRPPEVVAILGAHATAIRSAFDESYILSFAAQWSGASVIPNSPLSTQLLHRASVLVSASYISKQERAGRLTDISTSLRNTALSITNHVDELLRGCNLHASDYLEMLPELAVILAAFITADVCR